MEPVEAGARTLGNMGSLENLVNKTACEETKKSVVVEFETRSSARKFEKGRPGPGSGYSLARAC